MVQSRGERRKEPAVRSNITSRKPNSWLRRFCRGGKTSRKNEHEEEGANCEEQVPLERGKKVTFLVTEYI